MRGDRCWQVDSTIEWVCIGGYDWIPNGTVSLPTTWEPRSVEHTQSPVNVALDDTVLLCNAIAGAITINLPSAGESSRRLIVKKTDGGPNGIVVMPSGSETIDGASALSLILPMQSAELVPDGYNWWVVG